jgi:hypothetical protein
MFSRDIADNPPVTFPTRKGDMNAKQRRMEKRRNEKRFGLSERKYRLYKKLTRQGYGHEVAKSEAEKLPTIPPPTKQRKGK